MAWKVLNRKYMKEYKEEDFIMLSGIQHYSFCPRQWALIHIEQQWEENYFTVMGNIMHENAHDKDSTEKRKNVVITRGMPVFSRTLGVRGDCDVVEFYQSNDGIPLKNYEGTYQPVPVEYKRGKPKEHDADVLQLCAQAMCLEEMLVCMIPKGFLYYGEIRRRIEIIFNDELRKKTIDSFEKMHQMFDRNFTPKGKVTKACKSCSLAERCLPKLNKKSSVSEYLARNLEEEEL
jgi:CRISPR-associated exonuclease Cas4